jgi:hypothetical protein
MLRVFGAGGIVFGSIQVLIAFFGMREANYLAMCLIASCGLLTLQASVRYQFHDLIRFGLYEMVRRHATLKQLLVMVGLMMGSFMAPSLMLAPKPGRLMFMVWLATLPLQIFAAKGNFDVMRPVDSDEKTDRG